ncbi:MAG: transcriptional regulator GcvA [Hoeflea sp.]|uniref:transcriptional regulator GcvA n=1 Tax=Hoeflea sp. TaxID=1940281 RepID=UPI001E1045E5|nr:transcriptional regulator GcvA [Hoeflea sp.]MBU4528742.1 transcriptional regulator GcvA [Alphaproteobacteria bacterium]MBU4545931.1 transcriptional regulator GcvA [Alphaproteobacteria bacterium]MBU4549876.1 transcriptional regulator GcvA [Alphaproteobacteria bacterium]MBV1725873.1 transcriptional regulator GcvA [Hoeflea sp.]MBV1762598.1 transcriptional regulator GcvA [Hoeflea sp.]
MSRKLPPLNWLRAFEASARSLSFTQAASELNLTQAAISKQVKLLEHYLSEQLFIRNPRSLELTKTGEAYLPKVRDCFDRLAAGTNEVFGRRRSEMLTIRCMVGFSINWLAPRLPRFMARHPGVTIRIISSVWGDEFDSERFDFDIRYGMGKWPGLNAQRLTWETITPVCSPALLRGDNAIGKPEDLAHHALLHVLGYEEGWGLWLRAAGLSADIDRGRGLHFDTSLIAFEVAAKGGGIALGRPSMTGEDFASGRLVAPFDLAVPIDEAFHLITPPEDIAHPDADLFRDWLIEEAELAFGPLDRP